MMEGSHCFACCTEFSVDTSKNELSFQNLFKLLKLPMTLLENRYCENGDDLNDLVKSKSSGISQMSCWLCGACFQHVHDSLRILIQLETLEGELQVIRERLQAIICNNFPALSAQNSDREGHRLRKCILQGWKEHVTDGVNRNGMSTSDIEGNTRASPFYENYEINCDSVFSSKSEQVASEDQPMSVSRKRSLAVTCSKDIEEQNNKEKHVTDVPVHPFSIIREPQVQCPECTKRFMDVPAKDIHVKRVHRGDMKPYECKVCHWKFASPSKLLSHAQSRNHSQEEQVPPTTYSESEGDSSHIPNGSFEQDEEDEIGPSYTRMQLLNKCHQCPLQFKDFISLKAHVRGKHQGKDRPFECTQCSKTYKKRQHLDEHVRVQHSFQRPYICYWCDTANYCNSNIAILSSDDNGDNQEPSSIINNEVGDSFPHAENILSSSSNSNGDSCCDTVHRQAAFSSQKKLDLHILTHHQNNICPVCQKNFKTPYTLHRHLSTHHCDTPPESPVFICEICGAKYTTLKRLKTHQMRHESSTEPFSCDFPDCGKVFSEPRTLENHKKSVHENKFNYHCPVCGIGCQQMYMLNRHMMCHSTEKSFTCSYCPEKFKRKYQLIIHERKHTGERPFKCSQCGKDFAEKKKLKNHEFVHGGQKPYECPECSRVFALKHYLTHHINYCHKNPKRRKKQSRTPARNSRSNHTSEAINIITTGAVEHHLEDSFMEQEPGLDLQLAPEQELDPELQQEITAAAVTGNVSGSEIKLDGSLVLAGYDTKFMSVELSDNEPHMISEEVIAYDDETTATLENAVGVVVGEWIQFGFVSND